MRIDRPQPFHRRARLGDRDGGLAAELQTPPPRRWPSWPGHQRTAGGEQGARGFLAAYDQGDRQGSGGASGPYPSAGEPGSETWKGDAIDHPSAVTGSPAATITALDTLYWQTGNPGPDTNGAIREGDNLYSDASGARSEDRKLKWYYQTTPHDTYDLDATEPLVLVDTAWQGAARASS